MTPETLTLNHEKVPQIITVPPAGESLLHPEYESMWPEDIRQNPELQECAKERVELLQSLTSVFESLPIDVNIQEAYEKGTVNENDIVKLFDQISNILENDEYANRFILYMPFEILPNKDWKTDSEILNNSKNRFIDLYMKAWNSLLSIEDARANFIDGDFTDEETDSEKFPRVVKAAHLVSKLIEKKLFSFQEAVTIIKNNEDTELARSLLEGFSIAEVAGLLAPFEENLLMQMRQSNSRTEGVKEASVVSESRQNWLDVESKIIESEKESDKLVEMILSGNLSQEDFRKEYFTSRDTYKNSLGIISFRKVMERFSKHSVENAKDIFGKFESDLLTLWTSENPKVKDVMIGMWSHFKTIGVVDQEYLDQHGIYVPSLENGVANPKNELKENLEILNSCMEGISSDPELSVSLFPTAVFFGSRIKGYGLSDSDYDVALFVRPGVIVEKRGVLRDKLSQIFREKNIRVKPIEFWLDENMSIKNLPFDGKHICNSSNIDSLFSGIMIGDNETVKMVYEKLLSQYLYSKNNDERNLQLQDLEKNNLQYRLMHRGYRHFFPKQGKDINLSAVESLDKESVFWDAGYRRLVSKIFIEKVFLPQLHK